MRRIKWMWKAIKDMLMCIVLYLRFKRLKEGETVYINDMVCTYVGMNHYGFADGYLPQFSVCLESPDFGCSEFSPAIVSLKKGSAE